MKTKEMNKRENERGKEDLKEIKEINRRLKRIKHILKEKERDIRERRLMICRKNESKDIKQRDCTRQSQTDTV